MHILKATEAKTVQVADPVENGGGFAEKVPITHTYSQDKPEEEDKAG